MFIHAHGGTGLTEQEVEQFYEMFVDYVKNMVIEITETEQNDEYTIGFKHKIAKRTSASIAIDDYGSGYNSELSLLFFRPDIVKVDMEIIRGIDKDENRAALLKNLISYARHRNIKVLAEGVETKEELRAVVNFGVDYLQGYYLSRPDSLPKDLTDKQKLEIAQLRKNYLRGQ